MTSEVLPVLGDPEPAGIAAMEIPSGAFRITLRHAIVVVFSILTLATANAAEPREETGFGSNPGNLRMFTMHPRA